jgi:hypothetical protein
MWRRVEAGLLGLNAARLADNPLASPPPRPCARRVAATLAAWALAGAAAAIVLPNMGGGYWITRYLLGEAGVLLAFALVFDKTAARWLAEPVVDELDVTALTDGEFANGLWAGAARPVLHHALAASAAEAAVLWATGRVGWAGLAVLAALAAHHARSLAMVGTRFCYAAGQSPGEGSLWLRLVAHATACLALSVAGMAAAGLLALVGLAGILLFGADKGLVLAVGALVVLLAGVVVKPLIAENYPLALDMGWRVWLAQRREERG